MKLNKILTVAFLASTFALASADISWINNKDDFSTALQAGRSRFVLIEFYVDWCGWCKKLDSDTYTSPTVQKSLSNFICAKLNPEEDEEIASLAEDVGLTGYPFIYLYDTETKKSTTIEGYLEPANFAARVNAFTASVGSAQKSSNISWGNDIDAALAQAAKDKKVVFVDVTVDWCGWCKKLDTDVYTDASVASALGNFVCVKLDPEKDARAAQFLEQFNITGYPAILFLTGSGAKVDSIDGYVEAKAMLSKLNSVSRVKWY
jgi:thiol:disulfide interchange protein